MCRLALILFVSASSSYAQSGTKYALLVGVGDYREAELRSLPFAENDVTQLSKVLISKCGYRKDNVYLMTKTQASTRLSYAPEVKKIRSRLQKLIRICGKNDTLFLGFAGHGVQFTGDKENYFCPADADLTDKKTMIGLQSEVYRQLEKKCAARVKLLFVDACRNDPRKETARSRREVNLRKLNQLQDLSLPKGMAAFFSCSAGQEAHEHDRIKHGIFFHFVIQGLQGKAASREGIVTLSGLKDYVANEVKSYALRQINKVQIPELRETSTGVITLAGRPGEIVNSIGMKLRLIPAGTFTMGSPEKERGRDPDEPQHKVTLTRSFYMGQYEVRVSDFRKFVEATKFKTEAEKNGAWHWRMGKSWKKDPNASWRKAALNNREDFPVFFVNWEDAQAFCQWLSKKEDGFTYRLPTEAEWEYACRGGSKKYQIFHYGNSLDADKANISANGPYNSLGGEFDLKQTAIVGSYKPNAYGLYDMHGNVWEWCQDWFTTDYYSKSPKKDPTGPESAVARVLRGGDWISSGATCRSASRGRQPPKYCDNFIGFRVVAIPKR